MSFFYWKYATDMKSCYVYMLLHFLCFYGPRLNYWDNQLYEYHIAYACYFIFFVSTINLLDKNG